MKNFLFFFNIFLISSFLNAQSISGDWKGSLKAQGMELPLVLHISETENGIAVTMDSPAQGVLGIPVTSAEFENSVLKIQVANAGISYEGTLKEQEIEGNFIQGGVTFPLTLSRGEIELIRPQEPKEPFPYDTKDVFFKNEKAGIQLAGTLSLPSKDGKFPAVILISGSGPQNRNEELMGHKPFLVIADYLTRNGIAVLRFDDRGVADSEGDFSTATTADFATDVKAAIDFLKSEEQIDLENISLIGHSEGGLIAPMVANESEDIGFIVLLAAPGLRGDQILVLQRQKLENAQGINSIATLQRNAVFNEVYNVILDTTLTTAQIKESVSSTFKKHWGTAVSEEQIEEMTEQHTTDWIISFIRLDPKFALEKIQIPVLAMNGSNDIQVPASENLEAIRAALEKGGNKNFAIKEFSGLNHLFQESETGLPNEYMSIEQTFSPMAMEFMLNWILKQVN